MRRESDFLRLPDKPEIDKNWKKFKDLFGTLAGRHGKTQILHYLNDGWNGVAPTVVENWHSGHTTPNPGIQKIVMNKLETLPPDFLPIVTEPPKAIIKPVEKPLLKKHRMHTPTAAELKENAKKKNDRLAEIMANAAIAKRQRRHEHKDVLPGTTDTETEKN